MGGKRGGFRQEMMFQRGAKIHIAKNHNALVGIYFVDYVGHATFLHLQDTFSRYPTIVFTGNRVKGGM